PIEFIVWRELVVPLQLSRVGVHGNHRRAVKIVSRAIIPVIIRTRISGAPHCEVRLRIIGPGNPNGGSTVDVGIIRFAVFTEPSFVTSLSGTGDRVETPDFFAGVDVKGS